MVDGEGTLMSLLAILENSLGFIHDKGTNLKLLLVGGFKLFLIFHLGQ